LVREL